MTSARLSPTAISYPMSIPGPKVIDTSTINLTLRTANKTADRRSSPEIGKAGATPA